MNIYDQKGKMDPQLYERLRNEIEYYYGEKMRNSENLLIKFSWYVKKIYALLKLSKHQNMYSDKKLSFVYVKRK